jgi:hypothetical protein
VPSVLLWVMMSVMSESLTYFAALELLGHKKSRLLVLLDTVATAGLTVWAAAALGAGRDAGAVLSLFELKSEVMRQGQEVVRRVSEWHSGLSRFDRSDRVAAAHSVLVISSYFEALDRADMAVSVDRLGFSAAEQAALAAGTGVPDGYVDMIELLLREPLPLPEPHRPYASVRSQLLDCYTRLSSRLLRFVSGLAVWDELDERGRRSLEEAIRGVPASALERYDAGYARLAADNREFEVWAGLTEVRALGVALSEMSSMLAGMAARRPGERPRAHLARSYQAGLDEPIAGSGQAPEGIVLPSLREAYVNPLCRVAEIGPGDTPSVSDWWQERELVPDVGAFLAGYLTSPRAVRAPLVVLGEPGSGKSKLAEVLAARLPEQDFLPVLVELRDVAAESMILEQIEQAILRGPGERVSWHDLLDAAEGALPVVLLDGFDELVQATSLNRYDYLEQVREFQHRQAHAGHPVAVIVTSRTVVADHTRFPADSLALRLQPFTDDQVQQWLEVWNRYNGPVLVARGLQPLTASIVRAHHELAEQPLLLLMLAIFDAADNGLQRIGARIGRAELYERLLSEFSFREIAKSAPNRALPTARQQQLAERDMQRLAVVALAMFNRGRQSASDAELDLDLPVLFPDDEESGGRHDAAVTLAQRATGRFFFVHKSEAMTRGAITRSYEFLHATFGEFLVAWLAVRALRDLAERREAMQHGMTAAGRLDDGYLYAVLSFACMADRTPIIGFLGELLLGIAGDEQARCRDMLRVLAERSLHAHPNRSFQEYEPERHPVPRRLAAYSSNLVLMLVLLAGEVTTAEFTDGTDVAGNWAQYGHLWRSGLTSTEWRGLTDAIRVRVTRPVPGPGGNLTITLTIDYTAPVSPADTVLIVEHDVGLTHYDLHLSRAELYPHDVHIPLFSTVGRVFREFSFMPSWQASTLLIQAIPAVRILDGDSRIQLREEVLVLPGYLLAHLDYNRDSSPDEKALSYGPLLHVMGTSPDLREQVLVRLRQDAPSMPEETVIKLLQTANSIPPTKTYLSIVKDLQQRTAAERFSSALTGLVTHIHRTWPDTNLADLDHGSRTGET